MTRLLRILLAGLLTAGTLALLPATATPAAPLASATFAAEANGEAARVTTGLLGVNLVGARVAAGHAEANGSGSAARTANLGADLAGIGVVVPYTSQTAPPQQAGAAEDDLLAFGLGPALRVGALDGSSRALFPVGGRCTADGLLSRAVSTTAGVSVGSLLSTGTLTTTSTTALVGGTGSLNRGLRATSTAGTLTADALGVTVAVAGSPSLSVDAGGSATFTPGTVTVNGTPLVAGTSRSVSAGIGQTVVVKAASNADVTRSASGGRVDVVTLEISTATTSATVALTPLQVSATAPAGGLDCTPDAPAITAPANGSTTNDATPAVTGTGTPGATVTLKDGATVLGSAITVGAGGTWAYTPTADLADGSHTLTATQSVNGATSAAATTTFSIDATAPAAPVVESPADGTATRSTTLAVSGTGEPRARLVVTDGTTSSPTVTVGTDGRWATTIGPLAEGEHRLVARQSDTAGNTSVDSAAVTVRVDTTAPSAPAFTAPAAGARLPNGTPRVEGTGEPGATVSVSSGGTVLCTARVAAGGSWACTVAPALADGAHVLTAVQTDPADNPSPAATRAVVVDGVAPDAPTIAVPIDGTVQRSTDSAVSGTAEPGATVRVSMDGALVRVVVADGAGRWATDVSGLADGIHRFSAVQVDAAGNESAPTAEVSLTVDTVAPARPVISAPADGSVLDDGAVAVTGTGEARATLVLSVDGTQARTVVVGDDGRWSTSLTLADGTHRLVAVQSDRAGNGSAASTAVDVRVDTADPAAPVIDSPADRATVRDTTPTVSGRGEPAATVSVRVDDVVRCTAVVTAGGTWTCDVAPALADGTYRVAAAQADAAGNVSPPTADVRLTVDTAAPAAPVISAPANGTLTTDRTPTVSGTGEAGARLVVRDGGTTLCTTTVDADRAWSCEPTELADGDHDLVAVQTDAAGNGSADSAAVRVTVDGAVPLAPVITAPEDGDVTRDSTPTVSGTGEPDATVTVRSDGTTLCTATVDDDGDWSCESSELADGPHVLVATQTDTAGGTSSASASVRVTVDTRAPALPTIDTPRDQTLQAVRDVTVTGTAEPRAQVSLSLDGAVVRTVGSDAEGRWATELTGLADGLHRLTATQADAAGNESGRTAVVRVTVDTVAPDGPTIDTPADPALTKDPTPTFTGTGEPGATVTVREGGGTLCEAVVDADGRWTCTPEEPVSDGPHVLVAVQTDPAGNPSPSSSPLRLSVDTEAPARPAITDPTDPTRTRDATPTVRGTGVAGARVTVSDDVAALCSTDVETDGTWSCTPTQELTDGTHPLTATQADAAGNDSVPSATVRLVVDTEAPVAPVVSDPGAGAVRTTSTVRVSGTGEAGATLVLRADGADVTPVQVGDDGRWSVELTGLGDGDHTVSAVQRDDVGNDSPRSAAVTFAVDTRDVDPPRPPVIERPADRSLTSDPTPTVRGTGEPGATVRVLEDDRELCTAEVDADGTWSCDVDPALADGAHVLTARQSDDADNESGASTAVRVVVDTTAPAAPTFTAPRQGFVSSSRTIDVAGTGEPGARVVVREGTTELCATTVTTDGTWACTTTALTDGDHRLTATQTDEAENTSSPSTGRDVVVDTVVPDAPAITAPADGTRTADATPTVSGTGEAGARLTLRTGGQDVCAVDVGPDGAWTCDVSPALADGTHRLVATQADAAGNGSAASAPRSIVVDTTAPAAPAIAAPADGSVTGFRTATVTGTGEPGASLVLRVDGVARPAVTVGADGRWSVELADLTDGTHTLAATQTDSVGNPSAASASRSFRVDTRQPGTPAITFPASGTETTNQRPEVRGTGQPGAQVTVWDNGTQVCTTGVASSGSWGCTPSRTLSDGGHNLIARQATAGGGSPSSPTVAVRVVPPARPALTAPGATVLTQSTSAPVTVTGTATRGGRVTVRASNGAVLGSVTVPANGRWSLRTGALRAGSYRISATQVVGGRTSAASTARSFRVVSLQVRIIKGVDPTKARRPLVRGTGTPGARVTVRTTAGRVLGAATVAANGRWALKSAPLKKGRYSIRATQVYQRVTSTSNVVTFRAAPR